MLMLLAIFLLAYLIGSIPFGLILVRLAGKGDIRKIGSGNIGATNVLRTGSKKLAALTLLLDGGKGFVAVYLGRRFVGGMDPSLCIVALGVLCGHLFPIWLKFKGGKGVATALGIFLALDWHVGAIACAVWLLTAIAFRYSSLAALLAMTSSLFSFWLLNLYGPQDFPDAGGWLLTMGIALIVILRHHGNIRRLLTGTEPKIGKSNVA